MNKKEVLEIASSSRRKTVQLHVFAAAMWITRKKKDRTEKGFSFHAGRRSLQIF